MNFSSANLKKNSAASVMYSERVDCLIPEIIQKVNWHWQPSQQNQLCVFVFSFETSHKGYDYGSGWVRWISGTGSSEPAEMA